MNLFYTVRIGRSSKCPILFVCKPLELRHKCCNISALLSERHNSRHTHLLMLRPFQGYLRPLYEGFLIKSDIQSWVKSSHFRRVCVYPNLCILAPLKFTIFIPILSFRHQVSQCWFCRLFRSQLRRHLLVELYKVGVQHQLVRQKRLTDGLIFMFILIINF